MSLLDQMKTAEGGGSLLDQLREKAEAGDESEAWVPDEAGEGIEGVVTDKWTVESDYKDAKTGLYPICPVLQLDVQGEAWRVTGFQSVLRNEINKRNPQVGDQVAILYLGERDGKNGSYELYKVACVPAGGHDDEPAATVPVQSNGSSRRKPGESAKATKSEPAEERSNQHRESDAKAKPARRKPGQPKPADDEPPF